MPPARAALALFCCALALSAATGFVIGRGDGLRPGVAWPPDGGSRAAPTAGDAERLRAEIAALRSRLERLEGERTGAAPRLAAFPFPSSMTFAGQPIPLERLEVRDRLDYELLLTLGRPAMPLLWLKRSERVLPAVRRGLAEAGLPADLQYVAVIESDLRPEATSPAGAAGIWQFISATARRHGLRVDRYLDERRHPERATEAASLYLKELHEEFGDWFLALASYNAGEKRIREAIELQGHRDYFSLYLPDETRRYVFRALAAKLIIENQDAYGVAVPQEERYAALPTREETLAVQGARRDLSDVAEALSVSYATLRELNPQLRSRYLPRGTHCLTLPAQAVALQPWQACSSGEPGERSGPARVAVPGDASVARTAP